MKKLKIIKVITNSPVLYVGACTYFGSCNIINNNIYIATTSTVKEIKDYLSDISTVAFAVRIVHEFTPEVKRWIEELQIRDAEGQLLQELLKTVRNVNS